MQRAQRALDFTGLEVLDVTSRHDGLGFGDFRVYFYGTQRAQRALGFRVWKF